MHLKGGELFERISSKEYRLTEDKCRMFAQQVQSHNNRKSKEGRNILFWEILINYSPRLVGDIFTSLLILDTGCLWDCVHARQ